MQLSRNTHAALSVIAALAISFAVCAVTGAQTAAPVGKMFAVQIVDDATGQPLAGARITGTIWRGGVVEPIEVYLRTDAAGRAEITVPADVTYGWLTAVADAHVPIQLPLDGELESLPDALSLRMPNGTTVGGLVLNEAGQPIAGATVAIFASPVVPQLKFEAGVPYAQTRNLRVTTDEGGRWTSDQLPAEWNGFHVQVAHPGYVGEYSLTPIDDVEALRDGTATVTMPSGRPFTGRVVDEQGALIAGAVIELDRTVAQHEGRFMTDASGRFDAGIVSRESVSWLAAAEGYAPATGYTSAETSTKDMTITLPRGRELAVRVETPAGLPVANARVRLEKWQDKLRPPFAPNRLGGRP